MVIHPRLPLCNVLPVPEGKTMDDDTFISILYNYKTNNQNVFFPILEIKSISVNEISSALNIVLGHNLNQFKTSTLAIRLLLIKECR